MNGPGYLSRRYEKAESPDRKKAATLAGGGVVAGVSYLAIV